MRVLQSKAPPAGAFFQIGDYSRAALASLAVGWFFIGLTMVTRKMDSLVRCRFYEGRPSIQRAPSK